MCLISVHVNVSTYAITKASNIVLVINDFLLNQQSKRRKCFSHPPKYAQLPYSVYGIIILQLFDCCPEYTKLSTNTPVEKTVQMIASDLS